MLYTYAKILNYVVNMCNLLYVNYNSIKLFKKKKVILKRGKIRQNHSNLKVAKRQVLEATRIAYKSFPGSRDYFASDLFSGFSLTPETLLFLLGQCLPK